MNGKYTPFNMKKNSIKKKGMRYMNRISYMFSI